jgi:hypothetical protein
MLGEAVTVSRSLPAPIRQGVGRSCHRPCHDGPFVLAEVLAAVSSYFARRSTTSATGGT